MTTKNRSHKKTKKKKHAKRATLASFQTIDNGKLLRRQAVEAACGLPTSSLYLLIANGEFPRPIELSPNRVGWIAAEVDAWIQSRITASRGVSRVAA